MIQLGDLVDYRGRLHVIRGVTPMSVRPFRIEIEDVETGARRWVPRREVRAVSHGSLSAARADAP